MARKQLQVIKGQPKKDFEYSALSASMAKTFLQCKKKFYYNYVLGIKQLESDSLNLGTACHSALEEAALSVKENPRDLHAIEVEHYVQVFRDTLAKLSVSDFDIFTTGEKIVRKELQNVNKEKILAVEQDFDFVTEEGVRVRGFIDLITEKDPYTVRIVDYKTSNISMTFDEARTDIQLSLYDLAVQKLFPQYTRRDIELRYVKLGTTVGAFRSKTEQYSFRKQLVAIDKSIKEFMSTCKEEEVKGTVNEFCNWCSYNPQCSEYNEYKNSALPETVTTSALTEEEFFYAWDRVKNIAKIAKKWEESLKLWAVMKIENSPTQNFSEDGKTCTLLSKCRKYYSVQELLKYIPKDDLLGLNGSFPMVSISTSAVDDYIKKLEDLDLVCKIEQSADIRFNNPEVKIKSK